MKKAVLTVIFTAILFIILLHTAPARASAVTEPELTNNDMSDDTPVFRHDYTIRASAAGMYLASNSTGYIRIEHMPQKTLIEQYDFNFQFQWKQYIADELERFGGFYAGKDHYFLVYGQYNPNEEDTKEVIRVMKYDLNWNRLGSASIFGEQVWKPFAFGSLQMVEYGG